MLTHAERDAILATFDNAWVAWITAINDWRAGDVDEVDYAGAARAQVSLGAAGNTTPVGGRQRANDALVTGGEKSDAGTQNAIGWALFDDETPGTPARWIGLLDADPAVVGVGNTDDTILSYAHGLAADQRVFVLAAPGALLPAGLAENTAYFVLASGLTADAFQLSLTSGGAAINITAGGAAWFCPYTPLAISQNATPEFAIGALVVQV
jgi:hypothetical protein